MSIRPHRIDAMLTTEEINARMDFLAQKIGEEYKNSEDVVLIGLLRGSFIILADLSRKLQINHEIDFMVASSYGSKMHSTREVKILKDLDGEIRDKDVVVVEDIIDTGFTLKEVTRILTFRKPRSLKIFTLLDKPERREVDVKVDWIGFQIPDEFVVGMGIDYAQKYRNLPYIGKVTLLDEETAEQ